MWTEIETVRNITGVSEDDYTDDQVVQFITLAQREVNSKINTKVVREFIDYLDDVRKNDINGTTTTFYLSKWKGNYLGDTDYDGDIDIDDIEVYQVDEDDVETELTPTSINYKQMSFTLSSAPDSNKDLYVTYTYCPVDPVNPDAFLSQLTAYLASSYMVSGEESGSIRLGSLALGESRQTLYDRYYNKYLSLMGQLQENLTGGAIWGLTAVQI
jgi:hypothetical protein